MNPKQQTKIETWGNPDNTWTTNKPWTSNDTYTTKYPDPEIIRLQATVDNINQRIDYLEADLNATLIELRYYKTKSELLERLQNETSPK